MKTAFIFIDDQKNFGKSKLASMFWDTLCFTEFADFKKCRKILNHEILQIHKYGLVKQEQLFVLKR